MISPHRGDESGFVTIAYVSSLTQFYCFGFCCLPGCNILPNYFYCIPDLRPRLFCFQVEQNRVKLLNDQAVAKSQLQKKLGQFLYLTDLEKVIYI